MSRGVLTDIANARADVRYDGIATRYVQDFGRWNVKEVIDLGQSFNYDPGYTGRAKMQARWRSSRLRATVMQGDIQGRTTVGEVQRDLGIMPAGARLTVGNDPVANPLSADRLQVEPGGRAGRDRRQYPARRVQVWRCAFVRASSRPLT